jgi:hypothetical protein
MAVFLRGFRRVDRAGRGIDDRPTARRRAQKERAGGSLIQTVGLDRNPRDAVVHQVQEPFAGRPRKPEPVVLGSRLVYSAAPPRSLTVAQRIESGICHVNGPTVRDEAQIPSAASRAATGAASAVRADIPSAPCCGESSCIPASGTTPSEPPW